MEELQESELGSQNYWDKRYKEEIENFQHHGDVGEIWFGEDAVERVLKWMRNKSISESAKILDLGCGNGMFLVELADEGYNNLTGVDYSQDAIVLAQSIAEKRNLSITYSVCDILKGLKDKFDIVHDKGTYDAISLNVNIKEFREKYLQNVAESLENEGFFIITSCNWTNSELREQFKNYFIEFEEIPAPQFKFGGKLGNKVTSVVYKKK